MRYVRTYPTELPVLAGLLAELQTPVQIIAGARDPAVPPGNAEFLHDRLPASKLDIVDAGYYTWEDAADEYAALVTSSVGRRPRDRGIRRGALIELNRRSQRRQKGVGK